MSTRQRKGGKEIDVHSTNQRSRPTPAAAAAAASSDSLKARRLETDFRNMSGIKNFIRRQPVWIILAVASGACAAINGVFAKLTTTSLTSNLATSLSTFLGLSPSNNTVNILLRSAFFGLNLLFNAIMWALFTKALTSGNSTTRVSIINVSANFFVTAMLGWAVFGEELPLMWWLGAGLLACGNVVIGRREEGDAGKKSGVEGEGLMTEETEGDLIELDESSGKGEDERRVKAGVEADNPI